MSDILQNIKVVAFDADNTLYSTKAAAKPSDMAAMALLSGLCGKSPEALYDEFVEIVRGIKDSPDPRIRHRRHSYGLLCERYGAPSAEGMYAVLSKKLLELITLVPGIKEILEKLKAKGLKMFVITEDNRDMVNSKLATLGIAGYFSGVVSSDDAGIMKPSPKYYKKLLKDFKPEEVLVVGDNEEKDLKIPQSRGMETLLVSSPEDLKKLA